MTATISKPNCTELHRRIRHPLEIPTQPHSPFPFLPFCCANPQNMLQSTLHRYAPTHTDDRREAFTNSQQQNSNQILSVFQLAVGLSSRQISHRKESLKYLVTQNINTHIYRPSQLLLANYLRRRSHKLALTHPPSCHLIYVPPPTC